MVGRHDVQYFPLEHSQMKHVLFSWTNKLKQSKTSIFKLKLPVTHFLSWNLLLFHKQNNHKSSLILILFLSLSLHYYFLKPLSISSLSYFLSLSLFTSLSLPRSLFISFSLPPSLFLWLFILFSNPLSLFMSLKLSILNPVKSSYKTKQINYFRDRTSDLTKHILFHSFLSLSLSLSLSFSMERIMQDTMPR